MSARRFWPLTDQHLDSLCADLVREGDKDRFLATLFIDAAKRDAVFALYAFNLEIARLRELVSEPIPGEMRLQWWREILDGARSGEAMAHPVASALLKAISDHSLPVAPLQALIEARTFDLYDDPMPSLNDLEGYCGETASALFQLVALILNDGRDPGTADVSGHGGVAYALAGLMRALPIHARRGQVFLPADLIAAHSADVADIRSGRGTPAIRALLASMRDITADHLSKARAAFVEAPHAVRPAFLPLALVEPHLRAMARTSGDPFTAKEALPQWRRQWVLFRAARKGTF